MSNILSHVDQAFNSSQKTAKREIYKWTQPSQQGVFMMILKKQLNIDGRYQREEVSREKVMSIARDWDWLICGTISVIRRDDGTFWVFDGGHRTRAAFYRDDITELPCMVHDMSSLTDEARAFVARNTMVSNVSALARFRASTCAKEPISVQATEMLERNGMHVVKNSTTLDTFSAIGSLIECIKQNHEVAETVLGFCCRLTRETGPSGVLMLGMFVLQMHFLQLKIDVIATCGERILTHSQKEIEIRVRQMRAETGKGGATIYAKAILELINKGKRIKLVW